MDIRTIEKLIEPLLDRIRTMLSFGVVQLSDASHQAQTVQVVGYDGEPLDNVHHWEPYGFTSRPLAGAEALLGNMGASRGHATAFIVGDRRYRVRNLAPGEIAISDDLGNVVHWKRDRILVDAVDHLEVNAPTCEITATTTHIGDVTINGNLVVTGNITADGEITDLATSGGTTLSHVRDTYDTHTHPENDNGGPTDAPNQSM